MTRTTKIMTILLIVFFTSVQLFAENDSISVELDIAIKMAIENNLQVKTAESDVDNKQRSRDNVWNEFLPSISASATLFRANEEPTSFMGVTPSEWSLSTSIGAQLSLSMRTVHTIRKAMLDYDAGLTSLVKAKSIMKKEVTLQFYKILLLKEQLRIARITVENTAARYRQAQISYQNGLISELVLLNSQVYYENSKPMVVELENAIATLETMFKLTIGFELDDEIELKGRLEIEVKDYDADELVKQYLNQRFDIMEARESIAALQNGIDMNTSKYFPTLTFGFTMDPAINGPFEKDLFDGNNWSQQRGGFSISIVQLLDPFIPNSKTQLDIAKLESQKALATERLTYTYKAGESSIRDKVKILEKLADGLKTKELSVRVAERAYALTLEAYNAGGKELIEVKDIEQEMLKARQTLLQQKYDYFEGVLNLEYELNMNLSEKETNDESDTNE